MILRKENIVPVNDFVNVKFSKIYKITVNQYVALKYLKIYPTGNMKKYAFSDKKRQNSFGELKL